VHGIRGIKVLLDGIPLNDPTGFVPDLYDVDWATVDRIEVLRGPASSLYGGGGSGGIINITTGQWGVGEAGGLASLDLGSHGFYKVLAEGGASKDGPSYRFSASRTQGDGYRVHTRFSATNLYGKISLGDSGPFHMTAIVAGTSFFNENAEGLNLEQVEEDPTQPNPDALIYNEYQKTRRGTLGFAGWYDLGAGRKISCTLYGRDTRYRESVPSSIGDEMYHGTRLPNIPRNMMYLDLEYRPVQHLVIGASIDTRSRAFIDGTNASCPGWVGGFHHSYFIIPLVAGVTVPVHLQPTVQDPRDVIPVPSRRR